MSVTLIESHAIKFLSGTSLKSILLKGSLGNIGTLVFHPMSAALPPDKIVDGHVILHYYVQDFGHVLSILQKEKPVYLSFAASEKAQENGVIAGERETVVQETPSGKPKSKSK